MSGRRRVGLVAFHVLLWALLLANGLPLVYLYAEGVPAIERLQSDSGTAIVTGGKKSTFLSLRRDDGQVIDFSCRMHPMSSSYCLPLPDDGSRITVRSYVAGVYPLVRVRRVLQIERDGNALKAYDRSLGALRLTRSVFSACEALFLLVWFFGAKRLEKTHRRPRPSS